MLDENGVLDIDTTITLEVTWHGMEDLVSMGLVRSIGIRFALLSLRSMPVRTLCAIPVLMFSFLPAQT